MPHNVYIASQCEKGGIYHCILSDSGRLTLKKIYESPRPCYFCREGDVLYALLREPFLFSSGVREYRIKPNGDLAPLGEIKSVHGTIAAHLYAEKGKLYVANYINGTAILMPDTMAAFNGNSHPHCICPSPDGEYIFIPDQGTDCIHALKKNMEKQYDLSMPAGSGPRHMLFAPDGRHAYCANQDNSTVSVLKYEEGRLSLFSSVSTLPEGFKEKNEVAAIRLSNDGKTLFVSNRGHDSAAVYSLSPSGDALKLLGFIPSFGKTPREMTVIGSFLLFGNIDSGTVSVFSIEEKLPQSPLCVINIEQPWGIIGD